MAHMFLGIDTGGTFTDFVLFDGERLRIHKVLSTPDAPERAILRGVADLGIDSAGLRVVHGSTVATNAVLEGKGVKTAFITNRGFGDMLTLGRQARPELYNLQPGVAPPPVPMELCLETGGRLGADGSLVDPLTDEDLDALRHALEKLAPRAVAINLLFAFLDDRHEQAIADSIPGGMFVSCSSRVLPEYREYERGIATWLNAWVGPLMDDYLARLAGNLQAESISVMQSSGGTIAADRAGAHAVHLLLSGPAGGLTGARFVGELAGQEKLLSFDMGGTSTDVALIDGEVKLTSEGRIGPYPVAVPMVDMHTIGAGGGSVARVDAGGLLHVGPESAGAAPGPACYGQGGARATVTDANLVLGRLRADAFLGGAMVLDAAAARRTVLDIGCDLGCSAEEAAAGIVRVANEHMARALRVISVERGLDPKQFALISFGGAGGLHVCALAESLAMTRAIVPVQAGVLSALGMLSAPRTRRLSRTAKGLLRDFPARELEQKFIALDAMGRAELTAEGIEPDAISESRSVDLRYPGQSYTLNIPWRNQGDLETTFHVAHETRFGHRMALPVELVNVRVSLAGPRPEIRLPQWKNTENNRKTAVIGTGDTAHVHGIEAPVPVVDREKLSAGSRLSGPLIVTETVATSWIAPGWDCEVDRYGNLLLERNDQEQSETS